MKTERFRAGCKINLYLRLTGVREDGYHTLESLFLPLDTPYDTITVTLGGKGFSFFCSDSALASGNILEKAYSAFSKATGFAPDIRVFLEKNIPYGAGLGGGSSDAAVLLGYLNNAAKSCGGTDLPLPELVTLAAELGADVPFFLSKAPSIIRGIGEIVEPVANPVASMHLVLVCPNIHVPTAWAFRAWDEKNMQDHMAKNLTNKGENDTRPLVCGISVHNDLAPVVFERHPELSEIVIVLYDYGADAATMSGSGSSLFGLFSDEHSAKNAESFFQSKGERVFRRIL
jgi:4-diphosphocytidyl-2-C-methyl-D-erythritol kinase